MRHRSGEVAAVAKILDSEEFEDAQSLAKAVIEKVLELFQERDWFGVRWGRRAYGPFPDKASANKMIKAFDGLPTLHTLHSVDRLRRADEAANPTIRAKHCPDCSHPLFAHGVGGQLGCVVPECKCKIP